MKLNRKLDLKVDAICSQSSARKCEATEPRRPSPRSRELIEWSRTSDALGLCCRGPRLEDLGGTGARSNCKGSETRSRVGLANRIS